MGREIVGAYSFCFMLAAYGYSKRKRLKNYGKSAMCCGNNGEKTFMRDDKNWDFVTLLPECTNVDLYKDVGMIPYTLSKRYHLSTVLASYKMDKDAVKNLGEPKFRQVYLHPYGTLVSGLLFLLRYSKRIRCLNLYHAGKKVYVWSKLYKFLNRKGTIYLKLDVGKQYLEKLAGRAKRDFIKSILATDIVSIESEAARQELPSSVKRKAFYLPNGFLGSLGNPAGYSKKNIFLMVGRIGSPEKGVDYLMRAYAEEKRLHSWSLKFVGPIEESFKGHINSYYKRYPALKEKVHFMGAIYDKSELYKEYELATVFILPSRWENFSLAATEAISRGCWLILSDTVSPASELTNNMHFGCTFPMGDVKALSQKMLECVENDEAFGLQADIIRYANTHFTWDTICKKLAGKLGL